MRSGRMSKRNGFTTIGLPTVTANAPKSAATMLTQRSRPASDARRRNVSATSHTVTPNATAWVAISTSAGCTTRANGARRKSTKLLWIDSTCRSTIGLCRSPNAAPHRERT